MLPYTDFDLEHEQVTVVEKILENNQAVQI